MITVVQTPTLSFVPNAILDTIASWGLGGGIISSEQTPISAWALDLLQPAAGEHILDAGCGAGQTIHAIAGRTPFGRFTGIDHSAALVAQARRRNRKLVASGRCQIEQAEVSFLPFANATFDKICSMEALQDWRNPAAGFAELFRVLKPHGRFAAAAAGCSRTVVEALFHNAGFVNVKVSFVPAKRWLYVEGARPTATASAR